MEAIFNQLIYFAFIQSLLLLVVYLFSSKHRALANGYLIFLVFAIFIGLLGHVIHTLNIFEKSFRLILLSEFAGLLYGPTLYLFTKTALIGRKHQWKNLVHYVPSLVYMLFILVYFVIPSNDILIERSRTGELNRSIYLLHAIFLSVNMTYWIVSFRDFSIFMNKINTEASYKIKTNFFFGLHLIIGLCLLIWLGIYLFSILSNSMLERELRNIIWLTLAFIILFITLFGMFNPKVYDLKPIEEIRKYSQSKLTKIDLDRLKIELDNLMLEKKPYLNNKLLKAELSEMLGISNPELARLLNERIGKSKSIFFSVPRIKAFIELAKTPKADQLTLFGLAQEVGFNSKATFNSAFKKLTGTTPSNYFNKLNN